CGDGFTGGEADLIAIRLANLIPMLNADRLPRRQRVVIFAIEAREQHHFVAFAAWGAMLVTAWPTPIQIVLDLRALDFQTGRAAKDDRGDCWAMGFPSASYG